MIKEIPNTKNFKASTDGVIYSNKLKPRKTYFNGDGYITVSVLLKNNKWQTFGLHRLLAMTFIPLNGNFSDYSVNHIDGNKLNCSISNLEWCTTKENNIHAALLKGLKNKPAIVCQYKNGDSVYIDNIHKAARMFECDESVIWDVIKNNLEYKNCKLFYNSREFKVPENLNKRNNAFANRKPTPLKVKDLRNNKIISFDSFLNCAKYFNTTPSHIFGCTSNEQKKRIFRRHFIIVAEKDEFPVFSDNDYSQCLNTLGKPVIAYNLLENKIYIYESASKFIKTNNLSKKAITVNLKHNKLKIISGWVFCYFDENSYDKLELFINRN